VEDFVLKQFERSLAAALENAHGHGAGKAISMENTAHLENEKCKCMAKPVISSEHQSISCTLEVHDMTAGADQTLAGAHEFATDDLLT
jgi:hypothetical protein